MNNEPKRGGQRVPGPGKKLGRQRFEEATFMGKTMILPVAPIEPTPPGNVCLDPIGDYTKPIATKRIANKVH